MPNPSDKRIYFDDLALVPVHYSRPPVAPYGEQGKRRLKLGPVRVPFLNALEGFVADLGHKCPLGRPTIIVTGGVAGDGHGMHGEGRAIDIDSLWWGDKRLVCKNGVEVLPWYYAIEALIRCRFGVVINRDYNEAHRDHWHIDDGQAPGWQPRRSRILFVQAALNVIWGHEIAIDGDWGPKSKAALMEVYLSLGYALETKIADNFESFLIATAKKGFEAPLV